MLFLKIYLYFLGAFIIIIGLAAFILKMRNFNRLFPQETVSNEGFKKWQKENDRKIVSGVSMRH